VAVVEAGIGGRGEVTHLLADGLADGVRRRPPAVAVDQGGSPLHAVGGQQAPYLAHAASEEAGCLPGGALTGDDVVQDLQPRLVVGGHCQVLHA
jgi:hypothetical protein